MLANSSEQNKALRKGLASMGLENSGPRPEILEAYIREIEYWNPQYKLIAAGDELATRHILDSLSGLETIQSFAPQRIADVGSGAGLPGIPLSLWLDDVSFVLIERSGRRAGFLRNMVITLGLDNVKIIEESVEQVTDIGLFDMVIFRALAKVNMNLLNMITPLLAPQGVILAYKGKFATAMAEMKAVESRLCSEIRPIFVPGLAEERCLWIIRTINSHRY